MKTKSILTLTVAGLVAAGSLPAEEGGSGHYMPGAFATMFDFPPATTDTSALGVWFTYYSGDAGGGKTIPVGGQARVGLDATAYGPMILLIDSLNNPVLGGVYSAGVAVNYLHVEVTASATVGPVGGSQSDTCDGFGDATIIPAMIVWKDGLNQYSAILSVYAPTGKYDANALANAGKNFWTVEPTFGYSRTNPDNGRSITAFAGLDFNTKNSDTDYQSGAVFHMDATFAQLLPGKDGAFWSLGLNAFFYQQISGDSGSGATLGDFEGHTYGVGPALAWFKTTKDGSTTFAELKWLPELDVSKRTKGDIVFLKCGASW